jgi:hypothetical protein
MKIAEIFVYGNSLESYLVGLVVPTVEIANSFAKTNNLGEISFELIC